MLIIFVTEYIYSSIIRWMREHVTLKYTTLNLQNKIQTNIMLKSKFEDNNWKNVKYALTKHPEMLILLK